MRPGLAAVAVAAAALAGCPPPRPVTPRAPAPEAERPAPEPPPSPQRGGAHYGPEGEARPSAIEAAALAAARPRLEQAGTPPRVSAALSRAARELAARAARGEPDVLARPSLRAALARGLSFDPAPAAFLVRGHRDQLADSIAEAVGRRPATHVGAGAAEQDGSVVVVLLASERKAALSPFPREVPAGAEAVLAGAVARDLARPRVFVTAPAGDVREVEVAGAGPAFRARLAFPAPGRYAVEVVGEGASGPEVAALLWVAAGGASLDAPAAAPGARPAPAEPEDAAAAEAQVVHALDALRRRRGLEGVRPSPQLAAVARRHSAAMLAAGRVAHVLPGSGELVDRLREARVPFRRAYENVAYARTALLAHEAAEESPAHLGNMLQPGVRLAGVGIARGRLPSGEPAVYLTEILVEPPDDGSDSRLTADARVREVLWSERARLRLPPLTADVALDALAREAAEAMRARDEPAAGDLVDRALRTGRHLAAADVFVASAPADAQRSANLRDKRFARVGVGVVVGDSRRFGAGRLWMAVIYSD